VPEARPLRLVRPVRRHSA